MIGLARATWDNVRRLVRWAIGIMLAAAFVPAAYSEQKGPRSELTNSLGMKLVWVPAGTFMMGSPAEELERHARETYHQVTLTQGFYMGTHLVTQEQWQAV